MVRHWGASIERCVPLIRFSDSMKGAIPTDIRCRRTNHSPETSRVCGSSHRSDRLMSWKMMVPRIEAARKKELLTSLPSPATQKWEASPENGKSSCYVNLYMAILPPSSPASCTSYSNRNSRCSGVQTSYNVHKTHRPRLLRRSRPRYRRSDPGLRAAHATWHGAAGHG